MRLFPSILVPLDGSVTAARGLGCATWLAARLGARLHILSATSRQLPAREELERLQVAEEHWPFIELHQAPEYPVSAILSAVVDHDVALVVMTARGAAVEVEGVQGDDGPAKLVGHVTQAVIEQCKVPVLLMPPGYREVLPWERVLVPLSGEVACDEALATGVRLASVLDLTVHVAHVVDVEATAETLAARTRYSDAVHHEYPAQLEELVSRALHCLPPEERRRVRDVALYHGSTVTELRSLMEQQYGSVLVVGWHGRFIKGHARVLKGLLELLHSPVLLVKSPAPRSFQLKVGEEFE